MKIFANVLTAVIQIVAGYLSLFIGAFVGLGTLLNNLNLVSAENPNPWWSTPLTFFAFIITASFGVWFVGWLAAKIRNRQFDGQKAWWRTFTGSTVGILIASGFYLALGAVGMLPILAAVLGALLGYYLKPKAQV